MAPDALEPEDGFRSPDRFTLAGSNKSPSTARVAGAALPLVAASFALLSGLSTEVSPSGSWSWDDTLKAVLVVAAIAVIAGSALFAMFGSWGPERSASFKLFVVLGIAGAYLASAAASFVLAFVVSFTRDPPEC